MIINVFRHFDLESVWHIEFVGALSNGMDRNTAVEMARDLGLLFSVPVVVRRKPGLSKKVAA